MEIALRQQDIDQIVRKVAVLVVAKLRESKEQAMPELVTTAEAAAILCISPARMRQIADRYPHIKKGDAKQGKLLFVRAALYK